MQNLYCGIGNDRHAPTTTSPYHPDSVYHSEHPAITMCVHYNLILICAVVLLAITSVQTY